MLDRRLPLCLFVTLILFCASHIRAQVITPGMPEGRLTASFDTLRPKLRKCSQEIIAGHNRFCAASTLAGLSQHLLEEHAVRIYMQYDPRPIGGILTVRADLVPAFAGIGESARPIKTETVTQAVENMTEEQVEGIAQSLIGMLGEEYTKGSVYKTKVTTSPAGTVMVSTDYRMSPHTHGME